MERGPRVSLGWMRELPPIKIDGIPLFDWNGHPLRISFAFQHCRARGAKWKSLAMESEPVSISIPFNPRIGPRRA
jgi:hypothetical protein